MSGLSALLCGSGPRVYLCGPMVPEGQAPNGGYAAANARTLATLRDQGCHAQGLPYPLPSGSGLHKLRSYLQGFRQLLAQLSTLPPGVFHVTGLYKQFVLPELLLLRKARRLGFKTIYDVRAGSMQLHYRRLGAVYRWLFRAVLRSADQVMVEGREYDDFVRAVTGRSPFYFPNHIDLDANPARGPRSADAPPVLIYVGRVTLDKGLATLLDAARVLGEGGLRPEVWIVGPAAPGLQAELQARYADVAAQWLGSQSSQDVLALLTRAHFFVFASRHTGEGHSNALTEAMSAGCVPVVSRNGFNASVVGDAGSVLGLTADGPAYAAEIRQLWVEGRWESMSAKSRARASELFNSKAVIGALLAEYRRLCGK